MKYLISFFILYFNIGLACTTPTFTLEAIENNQKCGLGKCIILSWEQDYNLSDDIEFYIEKVDYNKQTNDTSIIKSFAPINISKNTINNYRMENSFDKGLWRIKLHKACENIQDGISSDWQYLKIDN